MVQVRQKRASVFPQNPKKIKFFLFFLPFLISSCPSKTYLLFRSTQVAVLSTLFSWIFRQKRASSRQL